MFKKSGSEGILSSKAVATRAKILEAALDLFAEKGFASTTMREIAERSGCSLGLTYRYFGHKEELVLALYERLSDETKAEPMPSGGLQSRYIEKITNCIQRLSPHRATLRALFGVGLDPSSEVAVLGARSARVRQDMVEMYAELISQATDAPNPRLVSPLATLLYAGHLLIVFFWIQDKSENQANTLQLAQFAGKVLGSLRPALALPPVGKMIEEAARLLGPLVGEVARSS